VTAVVSGVMPSAQEFLSFQADCADGRLGNAGGLQRFFWDCFSIESEDESGKIRSLS